MAKIVSIQDTGRMWNDFHILDVKFDNGDGGSALAKSTTPPYSVGEEVEYTKNDKGGLKIQRNQEGAPRTSFGGGNSYNRPSSGGSKDEQIARSVAFKGAVDLIVAGKLEFAQLNAFADKYTAYLTGAAAPAAEVAKSYQNHFEGATDLPF